MPERRDDLEDLGRLAPDVDTDAALHAFRRRRTRAPKRWPAVAAAVALVVAGIVGIAVIAAGDDEPVATGPADDVGDTTDRVEFTVLSTFESAEEIGMLRSATTPAGYDALLPDGVAPLAPIDFDALIVVSITVAHDACAPELSDFDRTGDTITPVFPQVQGICVEPHIPTTYLVSLAREQFDGSFELRLPAVPDLDIEEQFLSVVLEETPASPTVAPTCAEIERFSGQLVDVDITYDYDASQSPAEVASITDVVFSGTLTGGFVDETGRSDGLDQVGYEVDVGEVFKSPANVNLADRLTVHVSVGTVDAASFEAAITEGIPVVVFAEWIGLGQSRLTAGIEGFVTGCADGPLLGFTGSQGEWAEITDLEDLTTRLQALPDDG